MYHYVESGLDHIYLKNGFRIEETPYGETVAFSALDTLHKEIALNLCVLPSRLQGQHVRFLRKHLGLSQKELADALGIQRVTVARWEQEHNKSIPGGTDRALRVLVLGVVDPEMPASDLAGIFREIGGIGAPRIEMVYNGPIDKDDLLYDQTPVPVEEENWHKAAA